MSTATMEYAQQLGRSGKSVLGYYRQPNGWITASPQSDLDQLKYMRKGWEPLAQYGIVSITCEYDVDHPLEALFLAGGAKELPLEQIIAMGFHLNPPLLPSCGKRIDQTHKRHKATCFANQQPVTFPQLDELDEIPEGFQCRFCERSPFPTEQARDQHETVMHKEEKSDIRSGQVLADHLIRGLKGEASQEKRLPYACGLCPKSYKHAGHLKNHIEKEHS